MANPKEDDGDVSLRCRPASVTFSLAKEEEFEDLPALLEENPRVEVVNEEEEDCEVTPKNSASDGKSTRKWFVVFGGRKTRERSQSISIQNDESSADDVAVTRRRVNSVCESLLYVKYAINVSKALPNLARKLSTVAPTSSHATVGLNSSASLPAITDKIPQPQAQSRHKIFKISPASITPTTLAQTSATTPTSGRVNFQQTLPPITEMTPSRKCSEVVGRPPIDEAQLSARLCEISERENKEKVVDGGEDGTRLIRFKDSNSNNYDTISRNRNYDSIHNRSYDTLTTQNYDTMIGMPGSICTSNSTTMERPPNINAYRMTIIKALNGRASMPQLMHRRFQKSYPSSDGAPIKTETSSVYSPSDTNYSFASEDPAVVGTLTAGLESFALSADEKRGALPSDAADFDRPYGMQRDDGKRARAARRVRTTTATEPKHFFDAVFIPVFTNIVGTLLYLRMGYVAGQAGILGGIAIVMFSTLVIGVTALSLSAISSNGKQLKGGAYYVISRSLGPQVGGVIGVIFSLANVGMAALYIVGIAEFTSDLLVENGYDFFTASKHNDIRIFSIVVCIVLMLIYFAGPDIENRFTLVFFSTYFLSYLNWMLGTLLPVSEANALRGVTGYSWATAQMNMFPDFRNGESLISVFAVFFPGFTGMLAGVMYVDQLRNPGTDVAIGLFTSIATTAVMYVVAVIACGATMLRDASGIDLPFMDPHTGQWRLDNCTHTTSCRYGLMNFYPVAEMTSAWRPLIIIGMFGMTISSTMTNMDQGPQNLQAACKDNIFPRVMSYFAREHGAAKLPRRAYILLTILTMGLTLIGDLNALNGIVTNMFMAIYMLVNYACFDASFIGSPGWRPEFAFYNMWVSLFGSGLSVVVMFVVSLESSIMLWVMFASFLAYFHYFHPDVDWGDSYQAHLYKGALHNLLKLSSTEVHVKNYRPQILLLSGNPAARVPLLDFANSITKSDSLLFCAHIINYPTNARTFGILLQLEMEFERWLRRQKFKCFYQNVASESFRAGAAHTFQMSGLGRLRPNVLLMGFKSDWRELNPAAEAPLVDDYVGVIRDAFENNYGVLILRNGAGGFDLSEELERNDVRDVAVLRTVLSDDGTTSVSLAPTDVPPSRKISRFSISSRRKASVASQQPPLYSDRRILDEATAAAADEDDLFDEAAVRNSPPMTLRHSRSESGGMADRIRSRLEREADGLKELTRRANAFRRQHGRASRRIDIWWLYDDGGLTLLIPHLLRMPKSYLEGAELRIITLSGTGAEVDENAIVALLVKFRIEFNAVKVIEMAKHKLRTDIWQDFTALIRPWRLSKQQSQPTEDCKSSTDADQMPPAQSKPWQRGLITDSELSIHRRKTYRHLLIGQLLQQYSLEASVIVLTLPIPNEFISSCLYMAWLDVMTRDLPPVLFVRGNQTSVLTFYS